MKAPVKAQMPRRRLDTASLPYLTDVPHHRIGGSLKALPSHFVVTEVLAPRSDECTHDDRQAKHVYVTLTRERQSTREVAMLLADAFGVRVDEVGYAGLKDRRAVVTQTFSLPRDSLQPRELRSSAGKIAARCRAAGWRVECEPRWHRSRLRHGELTSNHFDIVASGIEAAPAVAVAAAERVAVALREVGGFANYFGPQRFGRRGAALALERGRELLQRRLCRPAGRAARRRHSGWLEGLELSGFQSALFNEWLARRVESGGARSLRRGDVLTRLPAGRPELGVELLRAPPPNPLRTFL